MPSAPIDPQSPPGQESDRSKSESADSEAQFSAAANQERVGFFAEFWLFLKHNRAWWMIPILVSLGFIALATWMSGSALAPFIYPLF